VPALLETEYGWLPGNLFREVIESAVRGGGCRGSIRRGEA